MKASTILKTIMKEKKMSMAALGRAVGIEIAEGEPKNKATDVISKRLKQKSISIDMVAEMADKMDYQVVIIPKGVTVKADWYRVDGTEEGAENE